jgi:transcriptional regulator with XRE-family HTH domain
VHDLAQRDGYGQACGVAALGEQIRAARERLGLRQEDVAEMVGVDRNTVGGWESGRHTPRGKLGKLREVLKVDEHFRPLESAGDIQSMSTAELLARLNLLLAQANEVTAEISRRLAVAGPEGLDLIERGKRPDALRFDDRVIRAQDMTKGQRRSAE